MYTKGDISILLFMIIDEITYILMVGRKQTSKSNL